MAFLLVKLSSHSIIGVNRTSRNTSGDEERKTRINNIELLQEKGKRCYDKIEEE